jgi:hypothetical protein
MIHIERCKLCRISTLFSVILILVIGVSSAQAQKKSKYACDEGQPETLCDAGNTCGSASTQCTVDITRSGNSSNVRPQISNAKAKNLFCVKAGTEILWMTSKKNTGFMVSFGPESPFEPDDPIMGGTKKQVKTTAVTPGCYPYDAGASISGTIYGMSGGSKRELVILP